LTGPEAVAFADDLTGALECGACFSRLDASVTVNPQPPKSGHTAVVINTATRHLPPAEAAARLLHLARGMSPALCFKKTDSTLRGNIAAELDSIKVVEYDRGEARVQQTSELRADAQELLVKLRVPPPPRLHGVEPIPAPDG